MWHSTCNHELRQDTITLWLIQKDTKMVSDDSFLHITICYQPASKEGYLLVDNNE